MSTPGLWTAAQNFVAPLTGPSIREMERASIRKFVAKHADRLTGRVLDFGAGKQPYRDLVAGKYCPFEKGDTWDYGPFNAILCTQVVEYLEDLPAYLAIFRERLPEGVLLMTYPTCWDEVEADDLFRYTKAGMELLLRRAGFEIVDHERRASLEMNGFRLTLGYGVLAK